MQQSMFLLTASAELSRAKNMTKTERLHRTSVQPFKILLYIKRDVLVSRYYKQTSHQCVKTNPARGDSTIMITENVKDSTEVRVALCSDGNIS